MYLKVNHKLADARQVYNKIDYLGYNFLICADCVVVGDAHFDAVAVGNGRETQKLVDKGAPHFL
jgi:hypothetical protein